MWAIIVAVMVLAAAGLLLWVRRSRRKTKDGKETYPFF